MKFENTDVWGFDHAMRGMRNPKNSWDKGDSRWYDDTDANENLCGNRCYLIDSDNVRFWGIGPNDMFLSQTLIKAGSEHRKFMRQIFVSVDITAPLYWWKEFDTYKVGTVANSTSTMHKIQSAPITINCFETDDMEEFELDGFNEVIIQCEALRNLFIDTNDKKYWKALIRLLPESWLQTRTVTMNYENLLGICSKGQRRYHKLTEWSKSFIDWARSLPYADEFIFIDECGENK